MDLAKKLSSSFTSQSWPPGNQPRLEIYTVIADAKIRELRETMASPSDLHRTSNVIHFSDGTIDLDDILEDDESEDEEQPVVDPVCPFVCFQVEPFSCQRYCSAENVVMGPLALVSDPPCWG